MRPWPFPAVEVPVTKRKPTVKLCTQDVTPRTRPQETALIRRALPNFLNFMRFLHPGQACAAKCASSAAELGWDGSLMHCKSRGQVVPSFGWTYSRTMVAGSDSSICEQIPRPEVLRSE